jgi:predicted lipoprotein with Yx(FWY)xxD motif
MRKLLLSAAFVTFAASAAWAAAPVTTVDTAMGKVLAGENGMTLYTFTKDTSGVSNCYDKCAENWPPLFADEGAKADGNYSIIDRKDGKKQWAVSGKPLYFWVKDKAKGDTTGDGVNNVWEVARP